jgi:hypothetical protein
MKKLSKILIGIGIYLASSNVIFLLWNLLGRLIPGIWSISHVVVMIAGGFLPSWVVLYGSFIFLIGGFIGLIITDEKVAEKKYFNPLIIIGAILGVVMILVGNSLGSVMESNPRFAVLISSGYYIIKIISYVLIIIGYRNLLGSATDTEKKEEIVRETPISSTIEKSYFDGGLLQYIGWSILGALVTIFTLGICFPWALCMVYGWETNHTIIEGRRLKFTGKAISLFGHWLLWILLTIITLGIYSFWLRIALKKWVTKNTIFEETK